MNTCGKSLVNDFFVLRENGEKAGYVALIRPMTFAEQCAFQRRVRDVEEAGREPSSEEKTLRESRFRSKRWPSK